MDYLALTTWHWLRDLQRTTCASNRAGANAFLMGNGCRCDDDTTLPWLLLSCGQVRRKGVVPPRLLKLCKLVQWTAVKSYVHESIESPTPVHSLSTWADHGEMHVSTRHASLTAAKLRASTTDGGSTSSTAETKQAGTMDGRVSPGGGLQPLG